MTNQAQASSSDVTFVPSATQEEHIENMMDQMIQIEKYNTILKEIKTQAKADGYDAALLAKVAKAQVDDKVSELTEKTEELLELLSEVK